MAEALIFLAPGHEEVEMLTVVDMLRRADISIDMVSITDSKEVTSSHNVTFIADKILSDADFDEAKIIILPGGIPGTPNLLACKPLCEKIIEFNNNGKLLAAVCAAPTIFSALGILKGHKATCFPAKVPELTDAEYIKTPVCVDGNIITSRGMGTCIDFSAAIIEALRNKTVANDIKTKIVYNDVY